ncbi:10366_t:CDS:2 [Paraglomus brasilianum]|uniref:10366_t:CDS:1 n=1 Tax=Paraglomus brasilianum TaxID=144538 RepID=A0A9N9B1G3_9GLOM|nr:10366_t:CDS:2 [Paraglomus brasilianum]
MSSVGSLITKVLPIIIHLIGVHAAPLETSGGDCFGSSICSTPPDKGIKLDSSGTLNDPTSAVSDLLQTTANLSPLMKIALVIVGLVTIMVLYCLAWSMYNLCARAQDSANSASHSNCIICSRITVNERISQ